MSIWRSVVVEDLKMPIVVSIRPVMGRFAHHVNFSPHNVVQCRDCGIFVSPFRQTRVFYAGWASPLEWQGQFAATA